MSKQQGKKGRKNKGTALSLKDFLDASESSSAAGPVVKKFINVDEPDYDDGMPAVQEVFELPTAPKAQRLFDDEAIPHTGPFVAFVSNLPFDADEEDIYDFFRPMELESVRMPREDGTTGRSRGICYVELNNRDDFITVLSMPDPSLKGRRIRIALRNETDQSRSNNNKYGRYGESRYGDGGGFSRDNNRDRERDDDSGNWRDHKPVATESARQYDRPYTRERFGERRERSERDDNEGGGGGNWRMNRAEPSERSAGNDSSSSRFRRPYQDRSTASDELNGERPKLNLLPRTRPLPEIATEPKKPADDVTEPSASTSPKPAPKKATNASLFGAAKPVDTWSRDLRIDEQLSVSRRLEKVTLEEDKEPNDVKTVAAASESGSWRKNGKAAAAAAPAVAEEAGDADK